MCAAAPAQHTRDLTASSAAQGGFTVTALLILCENKSVTVEMIQALGAFYPAAAGEKTKVRRRARATHARYDRPSRPPCSVAPRRCSLSAKTRASRSR